MHKDHYQAIRIVERVFKRLPEFVKPGLTEKEVAHQIRMWLIHHGAHKEAFRVIVASGRRSVHIHGFASNKKLCPGDILMLDFGARYYGFHSDLTRTYVLGKPAKKQQEVYNLLIRAQEAAIAKVKAGVRCDLIDHSARSIIEKAGYGKYFTHSTGHGVGKKIHIAPKIGPKNRNKLVVGQVVTIEPGIYIPGWGGMRVEDMVLVTKRGHRVLTHVPKQLSMSK